MKKTKLFYALMIASVLIITSCGNKTNEKASLVLAKDTNELLETKTPNCDGYYPLSKGTNQEFTSYDSKDKVLVITKNKILESKDIENGIIATCAMSITDLKGKPGHEMQYDVKCQNDKYYLNLESMFSQFTTQYKALGMKINIENGTSVVPNNLAVNDQLEDTTMFMKVSTTDMDMDFTFLISDRIVTGKEKVTTPAGTFDCMVLSQKITIKMGEMMTFTSSAKEWLSKGVGSVKSESYNENGNLEGYNLLTKFSR